jgi:hypothetical protein
MILGMPDDDQKPNPLEDLRKGLGLLFRAAKTTIEKLPTGELEEAVVSGAKEVGRAIENVAHAVEEQVLRKPSARTPSEAPPAHAPEAHDTTAEPPKDGSSPPPPSK